MRIALAALALTTTSFAVAQTHIAPPPEPTGAVSGHVFCSDTNEPARFARVHLEPVHLEAAPAAAQPKAAANAKPAPPPAAGSDTVDTTLDGSFLLTKIKPGAYYVVVEKDGYIKPRAMFTDQEIADPSPQIRSLVEAALPRVQVEGSHTEQADVRLERGAAVSGTILYDDGSPAGGLNIKLLHKDPSGKWVSLTGSNSRGLGGLSTDDRGGFRVASLLPDDYLIEADLTLTDSKTSNIDGGDGRQMQFMMMTDRFSLPFYGSGTAHISEAASFKLRAGQELPGQDMTIPIAKLHKLTGHVAAGADAHFVNAAKLSLVTRDDGKELANTEISREDGLFHFEFVPDGDYILKVSDARDVVWDPVKPSPNATFNPMQPQEKERVLAAYGNTQEPILLSGDLLDTLATVSPDAVPPAPATAAPSTTKFGADSGPDAPLPAGPGLQTLPPPAPQLNPQAKPDASPDAKSNVASLH